MDTSLTTPKRSGERTSKSRLPVLLGLLIVMLAIPLGYASLTGEAEAGFGTAALAGTIRSVACQNGFTAVTGIFLIEAGLLAIATLLAYTLWRQRGGLPAILRQHGIPVLVLLGLISIPFLIAWQTDSSACVRGRSFFWQSVFIEVFILASLAISYNLIFGFAGVLSFGHAAFFGIGAYAVGLLMLHLEWSLLAAVLITLLISVLMGVLVSVIAVRIRGLYFAIFTLAFAEIFYVLAQNRIMAKITGAEDGFTFKVPDWINAAQNRLSFFYIALAFLLVCYLLVRQLINSPTGRVMHAIRDNEDRAIMLGYNTFLYKSLAIVLAGMMASSSGILRGLLNKGASPNVLSASFTIDPLLMTLVGGVGTFSGPVVGAFLLRLVEQFLRDTVLEVGLIKINIGERWFLILGILFIISVIAFPNGIVGSIKVHWQRWMGRRQQGVT